MRLNIRLDGTAEDLLVGVAERTKQKPKEAVLDALAIYSHVVRQLDAGGRLGVMSRDGKTFSQLVTPTLEALAERAHAGRPADRAGVRERERATTDEGREEVALEAED